MTTARGLRAFLERHPLLKASAKAALAPFRGGASRAYHPLTAGERLREVARLGRSWQAAEIPGRQRALVDRQLAAYRAGEANPAWDALVALLRPLVASMPGGRPRLLEVGCSSGYHGEVFALRQLAVAYAGCDYSSAFVTMARETYPEVPFEVADATALPFPDGSADILLSGCCLLHIPDYEAAIRESARVAARYVVFHRTPVLHRAPTTYYRKLAYDVETVEIHFNEAELVGLFARHGLRLIGIETLDVQWRAGDAYATKEYVCEKVAPEGMHAGR